MWCIYMHWDQFLILHVLNTVCSMCFFLLGKNGGLDKDWDFCWCINLTCVLFEIVRFVFALILCCTWYSRHCSSNMIKELPRPVLRLIRSMFTCFQLWILLKDTDLLNFIKKYLVMKIFLSSETQLEFSISQVAPNCGKSKESLKMSSWQLQM